jgi:hypothetical protein
MKNIRLSYIDLRMHSSHKIGRIVWAYPTSIGGITNNFYLGLVYKPSFRVDLKNLFWVLSY